jgi:hypothetical protein
MTELDAWEISQLLARYGHIVDNSEWPQLTTVFTADAVLECPDEQVTGLDAITRHLQEQADRSAHHTVNTQLDEDTHGIRARSRIVVIGYDAAVHSLDVVDTIVRTAGGWRISRRQDRRRTRSARSASDPRSSSDARPRSDPVPSQNRMEPVAVATGTQSSTCWPATRTSSTMRTGNGSARSSLRTSPSVAVAPRCGAGRASPT